MIEDPILLASIRVMQKYNKYLDAEEALSALRSTPEVLDEVFGIDVWLELMIAKKTHDYVRAGGRLDGETK